jgi:hypothetical protein
MSNPISVTGAVGSDLQRTTLASSYQKHVATPKPVSIQVPPFQNVEAFTVAISLNAQARLLRNEGKAVFEIAMSLKQNEATINEWLGIVAKKGQ